MHLYAFIWLKNKKSRVSGVEYEWDKKENAQSRKYIG